MPEGAGAGDGGLAPSLCALDCRVPHDCRPRGGSGPLPSPRSRGGKGPFRPGFARRNTPTHRRQSPPGLRRSAQKMFQPVDNRNRTSKTPCRAYGFWGKALKIPANSTFLVMHKTSSHPGDSPLPHGPRGPSTVFPTSYPQVPVEDPKNPAAPLLTRPSQRLQTTGGQRHPPRLDPCFRISDFYGTLTGLGIRPPGRERAGGLPSSVTGSPVGSSRVRIPGKMRRAFAVRESIAEAACAASGRPPAHPET